MPKSSWIGALCVVAWSVVGLGCLGSAGHGRGGEGEGEGEPLGGYGVDDEGVPAAWTCSPSFWDALDGCDCNCGPRDPDCDVAGQTVFGCVGELACGWDGTCAGESTESVPAGWTCPDSYYGTLDGCDCNCGVRDPDCDVAGQTVLNCAAGQTCGWDGSCSGGGGGGGGDPCGECLDTCRGLPSCCTGLGCMCQDECAPSPSDCSPGTTFCCGPYDCMCLQNCPY